TVVDPPTVITTHLTEVIKENITELLSYGETKKLLDNIEDTHGKLVEDIVPGKISIGGIQRILQNLLHESISIRDLGAIMEAVAEVAGSTSDITLVTEHVRSRLSKQISNQLTNDAGHIPILALSPVWEQIFGEGIQKGQLSVAPS